MASSVLCTLGTVRSLQWGHLGLLPFQYGYWVGGGSLASLGLASLGLANLPPGSGAELQDVFLLATHAITFSAAEQNKTQLWACSSLPRTLPQAAGAL